jgi:uncharacterized membrane protein SpoIIM required for sporulation/ABC-type transport system involved in multi-copper enzyme maturation permease subunit
MLRDASAGQALASLRMALVITRREVRDQFRDWRIVFPIVMLTMIFPALMNFTARQAVDFVQRYNAPVIGHRLIPFLLMVVGFFPISISLVIALESFVGEKERHSIEPLLCSPLSNGQLYLGKLLAAMVPPVVGSYLGIIVYLIGTYYQIGWTPAPTLLIQIVLLTTVQATMMVSGAIVISSQTTSVRAANLLASFIVIPSAFLIQGESIVMFWAQYDTLWWALLGLLLIAALLIRTGVAYFNREEMLGRELDTLNFKWAAKQFWEEFLGERRPVREWFNQEILMTGQNTRRSIPAVVLYTLPALGKAVVGWYRKEVFPTLASMKLAMVVTTLALVIGVVAGASLADDFPLPHSLLSLDRLNQGFIQGLENIRFISALGVSSVWLHNLRSIVLATLLGVFSFGVLGLLVLMLPLAFISYLAANIAAAGYSPGIFLVALVLPHGLLEIPAMILGGAALLSLGATLTAPAQGKTIGEAFMTSLSRWAKVTLGLVAPLFLAAALVEVLITPRIAVWLLGG